MENEEILNFNLKNKDKMLSFAKRMGAPCNIDNPKTIQEKLMWLNIYDIDPLKSICADKLKVKDWAKDKLGKDICVPTLKVWDKADDVDVNGLPSSFVLKCNHGSGMNIIVKDRDKLDIAKAKNDLRRWMGRDFAFQNGFESHYHWIDRKVFAEEFIEIEGQNDIPDYKFMCFNGNPVYMQVISDRNNSNMRLNYYNMNMKKCSLSQRVMKANYNLDDIMPTQFELMKNYATLLSRDFKFVRVDFYEVNGHVYLGEMTFTPAAFVFRYINPEDEVKDGNLLKL